MTDDFPREVAELTYGPDAGPERQLIRDTLERSDFLKVTSPSGIRGDRVVAVEDPHADDHAPDPEAAAADAGGGR